MLSSSGFGVIALLTATSAVLAGDVSAALRQQAQAVCFDDAQRLCPDALPDEDQVVACMKGKRILLTVSCRKVYDEITRALK